MVYRKNRSILNRLRGKHRPLEYFFIHIMKASGTSFRNMLWPLFRQKEIWPNRKDILETKTNWYPSLDHFPGSNGNTARRLRLIAGHYPFVASELFSTNTRCLVFVRHPVDRTVSFLKHAKTHAPQYNDRSLREIFDDAKLRRNMIANYQTKQFSFKDMDEYYALEKELEIDGGRLDLAKTNLLKCDFVGLTEKFNRSVALCEHIFGWKFKRILNSNVSNSTVEIEADLIDDIKNEVSYDIEFYDFAVRVFEELLEKCPVASV